MGKSGPKLSLGVYLYFLVVVIVLVLATYSVELCELYSQHDFVHHSYSALYGSGDGYNVKRELLMGAKLAKSTDILSVKMLTPKPNSIFPFHNRMVYVVEGNALLPGFEKTVFSSRARVNRSMEVVIYIDDKPLPLPHDGIISSEVLSSVNEYVS